MNYKGKKDTIFKCVSCDADIPFSGYSSKHKYCNNACQATHTSKLFYQKRKQEWLEGKPVKRSFIYQFLCEQDGNKCSCCGIESWQDKPIRLWVDHIDGNASNNKPDNFRLVCPNCDSQSPTFGAKNTGRGRKSLGLSQYG